MVDISHNVKSLAKIQKGVTQKHLFPEIVFSCVEALMLQITLIVMKMLTTWGKS